MLKDIDFVGSLHRRTERDYVGRVTEFDKAECATIAKQYGQEYWDGSRQFGYGGYSYDGRWRPVAEAMAKHYGLEAGMRILDVGCGKGYLLYEFSQVVPGLDVVGIDISEYGIANAKEEIQPCLKVAQATELPFDDNSFDFVFSLTTLHNLKVFDLNTALQEIVRVGKGDAAYLLVESYRNESEKVNLLYWQLTCESFYSPEEWLWIYKENGYTGDYGFIYFE
jgi:protein-L-isoaspartate(D-aspartate) O-methyltransferase